jgi:hypothetical protein
MKYSVLLGTLALLLFSGFSFSTTGLEQCGVLEEDCMHSCCEQAGGIPETSGEYVDCGGSSEDPEAAGAAYDDCVFNSCRIQSIECVAPSSGCGPTYQSCFSSCVAGGASKDSCDETCFYDATVCITNYLEGQGTTGETGGCCGGFALAFGLLGIFFWKNQ